MQFRSSQICTLEKPIWAKAMCITSLAVRTTSAVAMIVSIHFVNHIALMSLAWRRIGSASVYRVPGEHENVAAL